MVTVICAVAIVIAVLVICLQDKVITSDEVTQIKAAVMNLVVAAQKEYGDGCGLFKLEVVKAALRDSMNEIDTIIRGSDTIADPIVYLSNFGESSIEYKVYCWTTFGDYLEAKMKLNEAVRRHFEKDNIEMTYNHLNVHMIK